MPFSFLALGAFLLLAWCAWQPGVYRVEEWIQEHLSRTPQWVRSLLRVINRFMADESLVLIGSPVLVVLGAPWWHVLAVWMCPQLERRAKEMIQQPRPKSTEWGFPSGDVALATVFWGLLAVALGTSWVWAIGIASAVGVARMVREAHWLSDVLGGLALGVWILSVALGMSP